MTSFFVSRHPGAIAWARKHKVAVDAWVDHLDASQVVEGDAVIGSLPIHLVADVGARGATYQHLQFDVSAQHRGRELDADDLDALGARLVGYRVATCDATSILCKEEEPDA